MTNDNTADSPMGGDTVAETGTTELTSCTGLTAAPLAPCTFVIFGASGDLTARKLIPSLFHLFANNGLPHHFAIVGCGRSEMSDQQFRTRMQEAVNPENQAHWLAFANHLHYRPVTYDAAASFARLAEELEEIDRRHNTGGNRIFYLAVPPSLYPVIGVRIGLAGLSLENNNANGWARIVVEKPFGHNLKTAIELDQTLHLHFAEHQIFRIDHYLAKETVQNILMLRFANAIFEPIWNRNYIDYVGIVATEKLGVEHRAGFYEQAGVLRDMFQNHMKQLLALTAMEPPSRFEADRVRDEKVKVFRSLKPFDRQNANDNLILGQYGPGCMDGRDVPGYRDEPGVRDNSHTPTFAMMRLFIDNWRWRHVPFYLVSGKRLARKETKIIIQFKEVPHSMFPQLAGERIGANRLTLGIYPEEEIKLTFQTKPPGPRVCLRPVTMDFKYHHSMPPPILDAYEKVLLDCMIGDQTLFWRQDGVEQCWSFLTPVLDECETCTGQVSELHPYAAGGQGPEPAQKWLRLLGGE
ncbi:MAG: glucose-6-phosphate dehydrogenase [Desulfobulbaceae bacterium]|nr:glucose-6-phosphate dehydrogenase [Desulfobulbaceae bacterium]